MRKTLGFGLVAVSIAVGAVEMPKEKAYVKIAQQKQMNANVQEKAVVKQEVKIKSQNYPRGNIATH